MPEPGDVATLPVHSAYPPVCADCCARPAPGQLRGVTRRSRRERHAIAWLIAGSAEEREADVAVGVVRVDVDQDDRLPGPERDRAAHCTQNTKIYRIFTSSERSGKIAFVLSKGVG